MDKIRRKEYACENQISSQIIICTSLANPSRTTHSQFKSIFSAIFNTHSIFLFSQVGINEWTMSQGQAVNSFFPRCTSRPVAGRCHQWGPQWSCRPAILEKAVTERPTPRNRCKNSVVGSTCVVNVIIVLVWPELQAARDWACFPEMKQ